MAAAVAGAYNSLAPDVRAKTAIFGQNYGRAPAALTRTDTQSGLFATLPK